MFLMSLKVSGCQPFPWEILWVQLWPDFWFRLKVFVERRPSSSASTSSWSSSTPSTSSCSARSEEGWPTSTSPSTKTNLNKKKDWKSYLFQRKLFSVISISFWLSQNWKHKPNVYLESGLKWWKTKCQK